MELLQGLFKNLKADLVSIHPTCRGGFLFLKRMENGFIKIYRQIQDWEWYTDSETVHFFLHCILSANWVDKKWMGKDIKRGQFVTSLNTLSEQTGLSVKQIRTRIKRLEKSGEILQKGANKYTVITVCKYDTYQPKYIDEGQTKGKQRASKGQAKGNNEEYKEYKESKEYTVVANANDEVSSASKDSAIRVAQYLLDAICETDPTHRYVNNTPSLDSWVVDIEKAIRIDGRTEDQFKFMIDAVFRECHRFSELWGNWYMNIQSGRKLRDQFDKIKNQIIASKNGNTRKQTKGDRDAEILRNL